MDSDSKQDRRKSKGRKWYNSRISDTVSWIFFGILALIFIRQLASFF